MVQENTGGLDEDKAVQ